MIFVQYTLFIFEFDHQTRSKTNLINYGWFTFACLIRFISLQEA